MAMTNYWCKLFPIRWCLKTIRNVITKHISVYTLYECFNKLISHVININNAWRTGVFDIQMFRHNLHDIITNEGCVHPFLIPLVEGMKISQYLKLKQAYQIQMLLIPNFYNAVTNLHVLKILHWPRPIFYIHYLFPASFLIDQYDNIHIIFI